MTLDKSFNHSELVSYLTNRTNNIPLRDYVCHSFIHMELTENVLNSTLSSKSLMSRKGKALDLYCYITRHFMGMNREG